mmetsp:Transcript_26049/g.42016  ORF Transcript_26049/g.42016 Transcript_26049/m.42016 type:complete len:900 (+) Transcript_26049:614-3313(+)
MGNNGSTNAGAGKDGRVTLPTYFDPVCYEVKVDVNLNGNFRFDGKVNIDAEMKKEGVKEIVLHGKELQCSQATFTSGDGKVIKCEKIIQDLASTTITFTFGEKLPKGKCVLAIDFVGLHNDQMAGFYRSGYTNTKGNKSIMVSTQFEALDARRCFPCIDEPARKATFKASLTIDDGLVALGNMPVSSDVLLDCGKRRLVVFEETPKMSTYLLAFCVGEFEYVESTTKHGVLIRVYTTPGKKDQGGFALEVGQKALDFFDDLFEIPYPLPKLDMIAIPEFAMGAMENWGLVTYREVDLLIDSVRASSAQKQRVASVVAHELAHQWFGNLTTMLWWDGLWLNEGFATWMQNYACDAIFPEWSIWEQFVVDDQAIAMRLDGLVHSHPIQVPIRHAEEVEEVFDAISYYKGACVVRMLYTYLGKDHFVEGLKLYMNRHKYANAETSDLWNAWEEVSKKPITKVMCSWTQQMGFPVVVVRSATWADDCSSCTFELEQNWFIASGEESPEAKNKLWSIPLLVTMGENNGEVVKLGVMSQRKHTVTVPVPAKKKVWIKFNGGQHIPMRVSYGYVLDTFGDLFEKAIETKQMSTEDRAGMLLDAFALTKSRIVDPGNLIRLLGAYSNEDTMPVYSAMEDVLRSVDKILINVPELRAPYKAFGAKIVAETAKKVGWDASESDGHLTKLLRACLIRLQAMFLDESKEIQDKAIERFEAYASDPVNNHAKLASDIKTAVIKIVLRSSDDPKYYNRCLELIDTADSTQAKKEIFLALGFAKSLELKKRTLDWCTSGALKKQDFFYPISSVSSSSGEGLDLTWQYLQDNFERIVSMIRSASPSLLAAVVSNSCGSFASMERADEIEKFFAAHQDHPVPLISRKLEQIVENTRTNARFLHFVMQSETFRKNLG